MAPRRAATRPRRLRKSTSMTRWTGRLRGPTGSVLALRRAKSVKSSTLRRRRTATPPWLPSLRRWRPFPLPPKFPARQPRGAQPGCGGSPRRTLESTRRRQARQDPRRREGDRYTAGPSRRAAAVGRAGAAGQAGARGEAAARGVAATRGAERAAEGAGAAVVVTLALFRTAGALGRGIATCAISVPRNGIGTPTGEGTGTRLRRSRTYGAQSRKASSRGHPCAGSPSHAPAAHGSTPTRPPRDSTRQRGTSSHTSDGFLFAWRLQRRSLSAVAKDLRLRPR